MNTKSSAEYQDLFVVAELATNIDACKLLGAVIIGIEALSDRLALHRSIAVDIGIVTRGG